MVRSIRVLLATVLASALLTAGLLAASTGRAAADQPLCNLAPMLCPSTTVRPPATTATTKAPAITVAPAATTATTKAGAKATKATTSTTTARSSGALTLGAGTATGLGASGLDPASLGQPLPAAAAPAVPELATTGTPGDAQTSTSVPPTGLVLPAALGVGAGGGLANHHTTVRILLSLVALGIAALAAAQLPASRRRLRRDSPVDGLDVIDGL